MVSKKELGSLVKELERRVLGGSLENVCVGKGPSTVKEVDRYVGERHLVTIVLGEGRYRKLYGEVSAPHTKYACAFSVNGVSPEKLMESAGIVGADSGLRTRRIRTTSTMIIDDLRTLLANLDKCEGKAEAVFTEVGTAFDDKRRRLWVKTLFMSTENENPDCYRVVSLQYTVMS